MTAVKVRSSISCIAWWCSSWYMSISIQSFLASVSVLRGLETKYMGTTVHGSALIVDYAGDGAIADSPLVQNVRKGSTAVRNDTIYLVTNSSHSFTTCTAIEGFDAAVYGISFTRF